MEPGRGLAVVKNNEEGGFRPLLSAAAEAVPLVAAASSFAKVLPGEFSPVVFARAEGGDLGDLGFLFCERFGFRQRNPH